MADLNADEQTAITTAVHRTLARTADIEPGANRWVMGTSEVEVIVAIAALDLPGRDAAIRADERAKVRAELLAIAEETPRALTPHDLRVIAHRVAPEVDHAEFA